jgi:tRNA (guanine-N7-)-methyltransferase
VGKNKHKHFAENLTFDNFFQDRYHQICDGFKLRGNWNKQFFMNPGPITLEVGCGKAEFTVHLASKYPQQNFVGIDVKGARMWRGAKDCQERGLKNTAFIRTHIQNMALYFGPKEVNQIWIPFPDPQPNKPSERKRLTSPNLLNVYAKILSPGHTIHLKTDSQFLYDYTLEVIARDNHQLLFETNHLYESGFEGDVAQVKTFYENHFLAQGFTIKYIQFRLNGF